MPSFKAKFPKITTELARCLDSHTGPLGTFREGDLVDSSNPDIARYPEFWAAAGLPTARYHELRQERFIPRLVELELEGSSHK
jgi:hypothetical protein